MQSIDGHSQNITDEQKAKLRELFPEAFAEGKIDWDKLKSTLGEEIDLGERYGLSWKGKSNVFRAIQETTTKTLKPVRDESVNFDDTENLFIEGDNLEVLKILQKAYYSKVKMIYIDPPYNTGNDFVYNDRFAQTKAEYEEEAGIRDEEGKITRTDGLKKNSRDGGHFHSNWLNMMYPRLYLARNLLKQDGVIFVSIDDNEVHNLRMIMNEIFGEENFIDCIVWKKRYGGGAKEKYLVTVHEYVLVYARNISEVKEIFIDTNDEQASKYYTLKDDLVEKRGPYRTHPLEAGKAMDSRPNLIFDIIAPDGSKISPKKQWLWSKERVERAINNNEIAFLKDKSGRWSVHTKQYLLDENGERRQTKAFSLIDDVYTQHGTNETIEIFGNAKIFNYPKPVEFLKKLLSISNISEDDIVLDFFAGSATTAHAVLDLNVGDGGNRKYLLVQLPEETDQNSEAYKAGYSNIANIGKERIRRAAKKIKAENKGAKIDDGFKVLRLEDTNFKVWDSGVSDPEKLKEQMSLHLDPVKKDADEEDLLLELMLKVGVEPTANRIKKGDYWVVGNDLVICLADEIDEAAFAKMIAEKPAKIILLDRALHDNDQLKANLLLQAEKSNTEVLVV